MLTLVCRLSAKSFPRFFLKSCMQKSRILIVEILHTHMSIIRRRHHFDDAILDRQKSETSKNAAAHIVDLREYSPKTQCILIKFPKKVVSNFSPSDQFVSQTKEKNTKELWELLK